MVIGNGGIKERQRADIVNTAAVTAGRIGIPNLDVHNAYMIHRQRTGIKKSAALFAVFSRTPCDGEMAKLHLGICQNLEGALAHGTRNSGHFCPSAQQG